MADFLLWLETIATVKAIYELTKDIPARFGSLDETIAYYKKDPKTRQDAEQAVEKYRNTYPDDVLKDIAERLRRCDDRFKETNDGEDRVRCICTVLRNTAAGNGGDMPDVSDWPDIFEQLKCKKDKESSEKQAFNTP